MSQDTAFLTAWESRPVVFWQQHWHVPELDIFQRVGSTNDIIKARAEQGAAAGAVALAELQTRGRGRRERQWVAPAGTALLMSMLFRPDARARVTASAEFAGTTPLRVGMAVARAIRSVTGIDVVLKWPNDVLSSDGEKIAGILCESSIAGSRLAYTVVGVGMNVLQTEAQLHRDAHNRAASLRTILGSAPDRAAVATALIAELLPLAHAAPAALTDDEIAEYAQRDWFRAQEITIDGVPAGAAAGIGVHGDLRVRDHGSTRTVYAGTVRKLHSGV
jgi:BirA family biotin operon repressor/biotin-[acetyl-CoA-carboxylase] ligase